MAGTSFGTTLLLRWAVVALAAGIVWAQGEVSTDNNGDASSVITILKFYVIMTGIAFVLMALAGIPFACKFCCFRFKRAQENDLVGDSMEEANVDNFNIGFNKDDRDKTPSVSVAEEGNMDSMDSDLE